MSISYVLLHVLSHYASSLPSLFASRFSAGRCLLGVSPFLGLGEWFRPSSCLYSISPPALVCSFLLSHIFRILFQGFCHSSLLWTVESASVGGMSFSTTRALVVYSRLHCNRLHEVDNAEKERYLHRLLSSFSLSVSHLLPSRPRLCTVYQVLLQLQSRDSLGHPYMARANLIVGQPRTDLDYCFTQGLYNPKYTISSCLRWPECRGQVKTRAVINGRDKSALQFAPYIEPPEANNHPRHGPRPARRHTHQACRGSPRAAELPQQPYLA